MNTYENIHFIGIGGIGVSAAAKWWKQQGATVSGSDMHTSTITQELEDGGIQVNIGHFADNIPRDCDLVIYSAAVPVTNIERQVAEEKGIPAWSYAEFLGMLSRDYRTIAVSGTNGKSTTTAMLAEIIIDAGLDPTVLLGTKVPGWTDGNMRHGKGEWLIVEACEHMEHMRSITPEIAVVTNIEEDHLDYYKDIHHIQEAFQKWVRSAKRTVLNADDSVSMQLEVDDVVYFSVKDRLVEEAKQTFTVAHTKVTLSIPGEFNAQNAAAALLTSQIIGVEEKLAKDSLEKFAGTWRRFEHLSEKNGVDLYSDYAHHPSAVKGTIEAFKEFFPDRRLVVVFEPHQYSRTAELFDEFVESFSKTDVLILSEVYEVEGRNEFQGKTSQDLQKAVEKMGNVSHVFYAKNLEEAGSLVETSTKEGDVVVFMGAGEIDTLAREVAN